MFLKTNNYGVWKLGSQFCCDPSNGGDLWGTETVVDWTRMIFSQSEDADVVLLARNIDYHESLHPAEAYDDLWAVYAEGTVWTTVKG